MSEKWKIHEKVVTHFVEFIGFMVSKMTASISRSFLLKKNWKKCSLARDICETSEEKLLKKCKYLYIYGTFCIFFSSKNYHKIESVVMHTINPMNSTKWVTKFSWIFYFLLICFSKKIFEFFSQMPAALGICGTIYKAKKEENLFLGEIWLPPQNARTRVRLL